MSKRRNGTNRAGAAIGVNRYTGKLMPRKKKNLPEATGQAQELKKYSYSDYNRDNRRMQGLKQNTIPELGKHWIN